MEQLFRPLKKAGLVAPWRGMKGGYTLAKPAEEVDLYQVLRALDDPAVRPLKQGGVPPNAESQAVAELLERAEIGLAELLKGITLSDLKRSAQANPLLKDAPRAGTGFQI